MAEELLKVLSVLKKEYTAEFIASILNEDEEQIIHCLDREVEETKIVEKIDKKYKLDSKLIEKYYSEINPDKRKDYHLKIGQKLSENVYTTMKEYFNDMIYHYSQVIDSVKEDNIRRKICQIFIPTAINYYWIDRNFSKKLLEQAYAAAMNLDDSWETYNIKIDVAEKLGDVYFDMAENKLEAGKYYKEMLTLAEGKEDKYFIARALNRVGLVDQYIDVNKAFDTFNQAYELAKEIHSPVDEIKILINLGSLTCQQMNNLEKGQEYYRVALLKSEKLNYQYGLVQSLQSLGLIKMNKGLFIDAKSYYDKAKEIGKKLKNEDENMRILINAGTNEFLMGEFSTALESNRRAKEISSEIVSMEGHIRSELNLLETQLCQSILNNNPVFSEPQGVELSLISKWLKKSQFQSKRYFDISAQEYRCYAMIDGIKGRREKSQENFNKSISLVENKDNISWGLSYFEWSAVEKAMNNPDYKETFEKGKVIFDKHNIQFTNIWENSGLFGE